MNLRELATSWLRANCPLPGVQQQFLEHLDRALQLEATCTYLIGPDLNSAARPLLVSCFRGEFFVFELAPDQAGRLNVRNNMLVTAAGRSRHPHERVAEPIVSLEHVEVDQAAALGTSAPITGAFRYRTRRPLLDPLALRVACEPPGSVSMVLFHHLWSLPLAEGTARFSLSPLGDLQDQDGGLFKGVVPLYFQVWTSAGPASHDPFHGQGADLMARPQPDPFAPPRPDPFDAPRRPTHSHLPPFGQSRPPHATHGFQPAQPAAHPYPPPWDPWETQPTAAQERPISDIRAVLVEIV